MPDAWPHPELEVTVPVLVAEAAHRRLAADPPLQAACPGGIVEAELEDVLLLETVTGTTLVTLVEGQEESRSGSSHQGELQVLLRHLLIESIPADAHGTRRHLRTRVVERIKRVLLQPSEHDPGGAGVLTAETGEPITDELLQYQRVPQPRYIAGQGLLITSVQSLWLSTIDIVQRTYV